MSPYRLNTIGAEELLHTPLPPVSFVVEGLLTQGLHLLAGAPKVGKSWLALWLCLCVAMGNPVWTFPVTQGDVLYLCLEDNYARIQHRLFQITEEATDALHLTTVSGQIGGVLEEQLRNFLQDHPATRLIVVDTLQRIRTDRDSANPYSSDYQDITALKQLADQHHVAILLIHHLRKQSADDPLDRISGSTGLSGAADSSFVLMPVKRSSGQAKLFCTGRDIPNRELTLQFDSVTCTWSLLSDSEEESSEPVDPLLDLLLPFVQHNFPFHGTATELRDLLQVQTGEDLTASVLSKKLTRYTGELSKAGIRFTTSRTRESRQLHLEPAGDTSDGSDGKNGSVPVPNFPSQASQPSREPTGPP